MKPTCKFRFLKIKREDGWIDLVLQQLWIDEDCEFCEPKKEWRDVPTVEEDNVNSR